jgi:nitroreductase
MTAMPLSELLRKNRSYRRFDPHTIERDTLVELIELTRTCPSAANRQPLKYLLAWTPEQAARIFPHLRWAAALTDWPGPAEGERPTAYIVILGDTRVWRRWDWDTGITAHTMLLGATERGLGGCMIGSIDQPGLRGELALPEDLEILMVVALGKPKETVVLEDGQPEPAPYWRDAQQVHHVPKRPLAELLVEPGR